MAKGYWIARLDVDNEEEYARYRALNAVAFAKYGAKFLVRGGEYKLARGEGRADDNEATARARIATFHEQGEPIAAWLRQARVPIIELDASQRRDEVWEQLLAVGRLMRGAVSRSAI